jgi:hypothetical protein
VASTPRWGGLRPEPYDPDAVDADNDGIVQEGTAWERPAGTKILDELGREIIKGHTTTTRPAGLRYVDANGKDVDYTPRQPKQEAPGAQTALAQLGAPTIGAQAGTIGTLGIPPVAPKLPTLTEPKKAKKAVKKPTIGSSLEDQGAPTILDLNVPKPFIPPKPKPEDLPAEVGMDQLPEAIRTPTAFDLDMGVIFWRQGDTGALRDELNGILAGNDVEWNGSPEQRVRMAAIMNAVADAPATDKPLYRGEKVWSKERFDELVATLKPGETFTTDMRGYGTDKGTAVTFAIGAEHQVVYEIEPGARALRLSDAVPMSRHRDEDVLWEDGAEELDDEMFDTISSEDEHIALGKYEVVSAELTLVGLPGVQKQRLVVKLRQTESLGKPEGGWDAPRPSAPATPDPEVFAAETQDIIDNAIQPATWAVPPYASTNALQDREQEVLRILASDNMDLDSPVAEMYRERLAAIRAAKAEQLLPTASDLHDPKDPERQRFALESWVSGDGTGRMRKHYDGIRDGAESWPDGWDDTARGTTAYDGELRWRAEMAAMMQAYTDGAWEQQDALYRGEALDESLETVISELYPVGREFEMPMRGFSTEEYTAQGFHDRAGGGQTKVMLVFDEDSPATALPLYEMYDELREWDDNEEPIEFLDDQTTKYLYRENEHLVAGTVRVKNVTVSEDGVVVVSLEHVAPLTEPDRGFEAPPAPSTQEVLAAMSQKPVPPLESALARIGEKSDTKTEGIRQTTIELADARDTLEDARVTGNAQRIAEYTAIVAALEAELVRQKSRPYSDDVKPPTGVDKAVGLEQWVDGWDFDFRPHFDDILAGVASADTRHEAGRSNGEPWPDDVDDRSWMAFLANRRRMAGLMNAYVDNGTPTEIPIYRGERLDEASAAVLTDIYPVGREFVLPMHSFTAQEFSASFGANVPSGSSATGVRITLLPGAKSLDVQRVVEDDELGTSFAEDAVDVINDEQEHIVAGSVRVVSSTLAEDGKVDVVLEMVEPLGYDPNGEAWR